ncbi:MAG: helicase C-terminal domain-containing protein [Myxococcaceae bacterium]
MDLSGLFPRHAFLDLETTGLDPTRDEVIELGVLFVDDGVTTRRVSKLFRPSAPLPLTIQRLTGIQQAALDEQPPFRSYVAELQQSLQDYTVVAHNAAFEESFLGEVLYGIQAPVLDSMELLHYLYPELESHGLDSLVRWANVAERAQHRALHDCEDTLAVLQHAFERCIREARSSDLEDLLKTFGEPARGPLPELLAGLIDACRSQRAELELKSIRSQFLVGDPKRLRRGFAPSRPLEEPEAETLLPVGDAELTAILGPGGALEQNVAGFRSRPQQLDVARRLARTLTEGGTLAVEAGTGTGKSLAYLTPSVLFAVKNQRRVGIAPHTKTLQDQLVEKDLPKLHQATQGAFSYAVIKGQTNYACRRRALDATAVEPEMTYAERAPRAYLRAFLRRSTDGDLDRLSYWFRGKFPQLAELTLAARSESATTLGDRCPHYRRCFYFSAVAQAKEADVVVLNQSLALAWPARYPHIHHLVVDEAHELEDVISTSLAGELSLHTFARLFERIQGRDGRRGPLSELKRVHGATVGQGRALINELSGCLSTARADVAGLGEAVQAFCSARNLRRETVALPDEANPLDGQTAEGSQETDARPRASYARERRVTGELRETPEWKRVHVALDVLKEELETLTKLLSTELENAFPDLSHSHLGLSRDLAGAMNEVADRVGLIRELGDAPSAARCYSAVAKSGYWHLTSQPIDAGNVFASELADRMRSLVLTSATLTTGASRPWVLQRLGLHRRADEAPTPLLRAASPFDLKSQALVILVTDAPDANDAAFLGWASQRISGLAKFMNGRVLGLFASSHRLAEIGERVRAKLEPLNIEVLQQARGNGRSLAARQEADNASVLLGTKSFWQGVDIRGNGVACVFIDKLPIEPHTRPLVEAREERIEGSSHSASGFMQYRLPKALILLRQGVGRLVRSTEDRGVVIIADPGAATYRSEVLAALEGYRVEVLPWAKARLRIFDTLRGMRLHAMAASPRKTGPRQRAVTPSPRE